MAQLAVHGPLNEGNLHHDFGLRPMRMNPWQPLGFRERRSRDLELVQPRTQVQKQLRVEAGADFTGKHKIIPLEVAYEQRAETDAAAPRICESADDEFLTGFA